MCGIAGIISATTTDLRHIQPMTERQRHRGPDSGALLFVGDTSSPQLIASDTPLPSAIPGKIALGHRRLSIIDTHAHGRQPMRLEDDTLWICYNGEVYNYLEIREELEALGHRFRTGTDTEVILRAYREWGPSCIARFNGMWAFAILDIQQGTLLLSRDRFGIKPLHIRHEAGELSFASEIKALLGQNTAQANIATVKSYLTHHAVNHTNATFFRGIEAFPPAHYAIIDIKHPDNITPIRYWSLPTGTIDPTPPAAREQFRTLFESAMRLHMRSDVPVGSCLSGGLDSSAIVCMADRLLSPGQRPFHTFTAVFRDRAIDESRWVADVNRHIHATSHTTSPTTTDLLAEFDTLLWHQDEPFTSASIFAQWCVMREARKAGIPVLLDGQGADEILCGYKKFYIHHLKLLWQQAGKEALPETLAYLMKGDRTLFRLSDAQRYLPSILRKDIKTLGQLSTTPFSDASLLPSPRLTEGGSLLARQQLDLDYFSLPPLLRFEDRNAMAFSIESRVPFLDHRLVEFCLQLAPHHKLYRGTSKYIMREALTDLIPASVTARRDKMGFGAPQRQWLQEGVLRAFAQDIQRGDYALGPLFDGGRLSSLLHATSRHVPPTLSRLLFQLFTLNRWGLRFQVDFTS